MKVKNLILSAVLAFSSLSASAALPSVPLQNLDGDAVNAATLGTEGKPVIVSFFATWCKPCMRELAAIEQVYDDWQDETGVELVAVSIDKAQDADKVRSLVASHDWPYTVLLDSNSELARGVGVQAVPHVLVIDGAGNVVYSHSGYHDGAETELYEHVKGAAKE
ncbi:MAG: TlpA family protein disulfide reductase [Muribaculaceae bacterium]|jgi:peroxiredoxin